MSRPRLTVLLVALFVAGVVGVCLLVDDCSKEPPGLPTRPEQRAANAPSGSGSEAAPPGPGIALLEGLRTGDVIDEWTVTRMIVNASVQDKPQLAIELERKGSGITIWVARKEDAQNPPLTTVKYALSFGHPRPYGDAIPEGASLKVMNLIAERVRRTEATVEPPPGL